MSTYSYGLVLESLARNQELLADKKIDTSFQQRDRINPHDMSSILLPLHLNRRPLRDPRRQSLISAGASLRRHVRNTECGIISRCGTRATLVLGKTFGSSTRIIHNVSNLAENQHLAPSQFLPRSLFQSYSLPWLACLVFSLSRRLG